MTKELPTKFWASLSGLGTTTAAIGCEYDGARWHAWIHPVTLACDGPLYKNPPLGTKPHDPGYFKTRHLDREANANKWLFDLMIAHAPAAIEAARKVEAEKIAAEEAARNADAAAERVRAAAPKMLAVLQHIKTHRHLALDLVEDAIREATGHERCAYPQCKCIVSTSTSQPTPICPKGLDQ